MIWFLDVFELCLWPLQAVCSCKDPLSVNQSSSTEMNSMADGKQQREMYLSRTDKWIRSHESTTSLARLSTNCFLFALIQKQHCLLSCFSTHFVRRLICQGHEKGLDTQPPTIRPKQRLGLLTGVPHFSPAKNKKTVHSHEISQTLIIS